MNDTNLYGDQITIEIVKGGFILHYPIYSTSTADRAVGFPPTSQMAREVFSSVRKMNQKVKEVLDTLSYVPSDVKDSD